MKKFLIIIILLIIIQIHAYQKVGIALSGGGARGFAHIGVLKVFDEENIKIDYISGTSSGALIATLYACGYSAEDIEDILTDRYQLNQANTSISRDNKQIRYKHWQDDSSFSFRLYKNYLPMLPESITSGNSIINELFMLTWDFYDVKDFDDLYIPLRISATDIISGEPHVFYNGSLHEAIFASFCFPTILKPFELNDNYYIDGGIRSNLPIEPLLATDADYLIGVKVNSPLKQPEEISNVVDILEQTAGIAIKSNVQESVNYCDLLILPELKDISMLDFESISESIAAGEKAARKLLPELKILPKRGENRQKPKTNNFVNFSKIEVRGNTYLQDEEVLQALEIEKDKKYNKYQIKEAFKQAYNTDLFQLIYPVINTHNSSQSLTVKVKEKMRSHLKVNPILNSDTGISIQTLTSFKNLIQPNSQILLSLKLSQNSQLCFDYLKNVGNEYGFYYHLFPYIKEIPLYLYDEDNFKTNSVSCLEIGQSSGIGFFFRKSLSIELYGYAYYKKLYRNIGIEDVSEDAFIARGIGTKLYFETLDDLVFPKKGIQLISKYYVARSDENKEKYYQRSLHKFQLVHPLSSNLSLKYKFEYGSYFEEMVPHDPFYIGGIDSFLGLHMYDRSASIYKISRFSLNINPLRKLYIELLVNNLKLGDFDDWDIDNDLEWGGGMIIGYQSPLGPLRAGVGIMEGKNITGYLNLGYDLDVFEFSER